MSTLPAADPLLVAETIAALPARLRAKLDGLVAGSDQWQVTGRIVRLPSGVDVELEPDEGVLRQADQVRCGCLLAPACLHRASVLAAAPIADSAASEEVSQAAVAGSAVLPGWQPEQRQAASQVQLAAARILDVGLQSTGAAVQAELLLALHRARLEGLPRLAAAATRVVSGVRAGRGDDESFTLEGLTRDLLELLEVAHAVQTGADDVALWRGQARSAYAPVGGLRLTGLCLEPVVSGSGYAGVVVWVMDADGRVWSVSNVKPGGPERVRSAAQEAVALGEAGLTHQQLSRGGLVLSGGTANPDGRLGAGLKVRAVSAPGCPWSAEPLRSRFGAAREASLMLLDLTVAASTETALLAVDVDGTPLRLLAPPTAPGTVFRDNLRLLAAAPGLRFLAVGRPSADSARTIELLAVGGGDLRLPDHLGGHADLGLDRLSAAFLIPSGPVPPFPPEIETVDPQSAFRRRLARVVSGGRRTLNSPGIATALRIEAAGLRRAQLITGADRLEALVAAGRLGARDVFGRTITDDPEALSREWLAAGLYLRWVDSALRRAEWEA